MTFHLIWFGFIATTLELFSGYWLICSTFSFLAFLAFGLSIFILFPFYVLFYLLPQRLQYMSLTYYSLVTLQLLIFPHVAMTLQHFNSIYLSSTFLYYFGCIFNPTYVLDPITPHFCYMINIIYICPCIFLNVLFWNESFQK